MIRSWFETLPDGLVLKLIMIVRLLSELYNSLEIRGCHEFVDVNTTFSLITKVIQSRKRVWALVFKLVRAEWMHWLSFWIFACNFILTHKSEKDNLGNNTKPDFSWKKHKFSCNIIRRINLSVFFSFIFGGTDSPVQLWHALTDTPVWLWHLKICDTWIHGHTEKRPIEVVSHIKI